MGAPWPSPGPAHVPLPPPGRFSAVVAYLRRHPILCLFLLTPGLPEYLSGSSSFVFLVVSPFWFFLALGINTAMYTSGALLVREALIRWRKGWPTAFALRAAYAIMEEGIADQTIFNPTSSPIGSAGTYGHFVGVNWLWFPDILLIHSLISLFVPILLLGYALPETRGRSLLTVRQIGLVSLVIALDTAFLTVLVVGKTGYRYGLPMLAVAVASIAGLSALGWRLPRELPDPRTGAPTAPRWQFLPRRRPRLSADRSRSGGRRRWAGSGGGRLRRDLCHAIRGPVLGAGPRGDRAERATHRRFLGRPFGLPDPDRPHRLVPARIRPRGRRGGDLLPLLARPGPGSSLALCPVASRSPTSADVIRRQVLWAVLGAQKVQRRIPTKIVVASTASTNKVIPANVRSPEEANSPVEITTRESGVASSTITPRRTSPAGPP